MSRELVDGVWTIACRGVNAFLVADGDDVVLVDAGTPWDAGRIREGVRDAGFELGDVDRVLVTHYDVDHVGALAKLDDDLAATVYASGTDGRILTSERRPPLRGKKAVLTRLVSVPLVDRPDLDVRFVDEGDTVGSFEVFETPGHTPGHLCFVSERLGVALLGDLVSGNADGSLGRVPWVVDGNRRRAGESIREFAERAPAFEVACMGHGDPLASGGGDAVAALAARLS
ncbi:MBL fold metallo-hydrolase [Halorubellus sp. PRR65]|uniref:MBL fold metallo-hydrolase n=1 Tax=Halorubellus sp. PRR65 TaxID=3098148 RepID=UPI002B260737|nr:MBL fold metallo-hydrolase [Halorubellus sp. PRR65]